MKRFGLALLLLAACGDERHAAKPAPDAAVVASSDGGGVVADAGPVEWIGVIASSEVVDVAPPFDGVIAEVKVRPGDVVAAGDVIAVLDVRPLKEELASAKAALREARAGASRMSVEVQSARARVEREERAVADGTSARAVLEDARFALKAAEAAAGEARASVGQADTRVDRAEARLSETVVRARIAGTIGARYRDAGASTGPQAPIVRIVGGGGLRLRFAVLPDAARLLKLGARVTATIDTVETPVDAVVEQITREVDQPSQMVFVDAALVASEGLQPGLAARVTPAKPASP